MSAPGWLVAGIPAVTALSVPGQIDAGSELFSIMLSVARNICYRIQENINLFELIVQAEADPHETGKGQLRILAKSFNFFLTHMQQLFHIGMRGRTGRS